MKRATDGPSIATGEWPPLPGALAAQGIGLRPERPGDRGFLRHLYGTQRAAELLLLPWSEAEKARFLDDQFRLQSLHFDREAGAERWILVGGTPPLASEPIGRLYLDRTAPVWRLLEIALLPPLQGRGIGSALLEWLHHAAGDAGAEAIALHVAINNRRAEALYRRLGYRDVPSDWPTHRRMRRPLTPAAGG